MSDPQQSLGTRGEAWVAARLRHAGYTILDRNWRQPTLGELDIVARRADVVVFVEVRTRRGSLQAAIDAALQSVDARKQARLSALAQAYLAAHDLEHAAHRIDVAAVGYNGTAFAMEVITNAVDW
jgi:putative endonuclease